jgi:hypothetical protein
MAFRRYAADGALRVRVVDGDTLTGQTAPDGAVHVSVSDGTNRGLFAAGGSIRVTVADDTAAHSKYYAPDGSMYVTETEGEPRGAQYVEVIDGDLGGLGIIELDDTSYLEDTDNLSVLAQASVTGGTGPWTFGLSADESGVLNMEEDGEMWLDGAFDYETLPSFEITVTAFNGVDLIERDFTITITNIFEVVLEELTLDDYGIAENAAQGTLVGAVVGKSAGSSLSITNTTPNQFQLDGLDVEAGSATSGAAGSYSIILTETHADASNSPLATPISINVGPTLAALSLGAANEVFENDPEDTVVGALTGMTTGSTLSMTDTASNRFKLSGNNVVVGSNAAGIDYETATSHNITVRETHTYGLNSPRDTVLTINVINVADGGSPTLPYFVIMFR